jgi:hypothetical protein
VTGVRESNTALGINLGVLGRVIQLARKAGIVGKW